MGLRNKALVGVFKTWRELQDEGFKESYDYCYMGEKRYPESKFSRSFIDLYCGKEVYITHIDHEGQKIKFRGKSSINSCSVFLLKNHKFILNKTVKAPSKFKIKNFLEKDVWVQHYKGVSFKFPCAYSDLSEDEAIELAKLILKKAKK